MSIFPVFTRFPELFEVYFFHRRRSAQVELEELSDEELEDVGVELHKRNVDTVKPFWMP
jgi:uncharacterized protein YjiS (DUF1127 family)